MKEQNKRKESNQNIIEQKEIIEKLRSKEIETKQKKYSNPIETLLVEQEQQKKSQLKK